MSSTGVNPLKRGSSGGVHFTWLLSTEREDDLDMVSDDDGDDAMVQLDEEYIGEMERKAALRDAENENEVDSDIDQLDEEDRMARLEYDDGPSLVSPRHNGDPSLASEDRHSRARYIPTCFERTMHHIPCTSCCFPLDGSHRKDCTKAKVIKRTKRFCAPNMELLRTLRVVKHVRIFRKILSGTSKASYYQPEKSSSGTTNSSSDAADLGLSDVDEPSLSTHEPSPGNVGDRTGEDNSMEMDQLVTNEITGETTKRRTFANGQTDETSVELDLESGSNRSTEHLRGEEAGTGLHAMSKPSWPMRKQAAVRRVKALAQETLANVKPGILTAFVNFPLVMAVAGGVGAHPYFGLNAAFWAALTATLFGGSRYTIAAPTMLLTANLVETVSTYGTFVLPIIALLSALMVFVLIFTRAIEFITFVPSMTTHGVTLGTTALVIIYQFKFALGLPVTIHAKSVPYYILELVKVAFVSSNWRAVVMFSVSIMISYTVIRWGRGLNVGFVLVPLGIFSGWLLDFWLKNQAMELPYIETLGTRYGHVEFHPFLLTHWQTALFNWEVVGKAMEIAFICVMESYATANLTFEITGKRFSKNHEMFALATGNFISGIFGGMPTSVGVTRTLLNIRSGATSRAAGLVNGLALLLFAITMTSWLRWFPLPVVAALQVTSAWRSVNTAVWSKVWKEDRNAAVTSLATAFLCVAIDPFIGLLIGIVVSMSIFSRQLSKGHSELTVKTKVHRIQVDKALLSNSFTSLPTLSSPPRGPTSPPPSSSSTHVVPRLNLSSTAIPPRLRGAKLNLGASLTDLPASKTISIRNAVAQLQPLLGDDADDSDRQVNYNVVVYRISGVLTFINAQTHYETLKAIIKNNITCLILNVRFLYYVDYDGKGVLKTLMEYIDSILPLPSYLVGVTADLNKSLKKDDWYKKKRKDNLIWKLETDAFKDIQRRNAELIEAGNDSNTENDTSTTSAAHVVASPSGHPTSVDPIIDTPMAAASRRLGSSSSITRTNSATKISPSASLTTLPPFNRQASSGSVGGGGGTATPNYPDGGATEFSTKPKLSFVSRHSSIGAELPRSPHPQHYHQLSVLPSEQPLDLVTTEELMEAISEAALAQGIDPMMAVASTEAIIRANRAHRVGSGANLLVSDSEGGGTTTDGGSVYAPPFQLPPSGLGLQSSSASPSNILSSPPAGVGRRVHLMNSGEVPIHRLMPSSSSSGVPQAKEPSASSASYSSAPSAFSSSFSSSSLSRPPPRNRFRVSQPVSSTPHPTPTPSEDEIPHSASSVERADSSSSYSTTTAPTRRRFLKRGLSNSGGADFAEDELSDGSSHHSSPSSSSGTSSSSSSDEGDMDSGIVDGQYSDDHYLTSPEDMTERRRRTGISPPDLSSSHALYASSVSAPAHTSILNDPPRVTITSSDDSVLPKSHHDGLNKSTEGGN